MPVSIRLISISNVNKCNVSRNSLSSNGNHRATSHRVSGVLKGVCVSVCHHWWQGTSEVGHWELPESPEDSCQCQKPKTLRGSFPQVCTDTDCVFYIYGNMGKMGLCQFCLMSLFAPGSPTSPLFGADT